MCFEPLVFLPTCGAYLYHVCGFHWCGTKDSQRERQSPQHLNNHFRMSSVPKSLATESKSHREPEEIIIYKKYPNCGSRRDGEAQDLWSQKMLDGVGVARCLDRMGRVHQETIHVGEKKKEHLTCSDMRKILNTGNWKEHSGCPLWTKGFLFS